MLLNERPTSLVFLLTPLFFCAPAVVVGSLSARVRAALLSRPVLRALLLLDAYLKEPTLSLAEFDYGGPSVLALVFALGELPTARQDRLRFPPIGVEVQGRHGEDGGSLRLFGFFDLRGQRGRKHLGLLCAIKAGVFCEPFLKSPDRLEPFARVLRIAAEGRKDRSNAST
jgi:hypothetical protein